MYRSTRTPEDRVPFADALFRGLAPDGGLYVPEHHPDLSGLMASLPEGSAFADTAAALSRGLFGDELGEETAERIARRAFSFSPALRPVTEGIAVLELFHGPSCAFKDFGAGFLAAAMEELLAGEERRAVVLTATSGDTGAAVARAFHGREHIDVVILYPSGRVSPLQEKQLTALGGNVTALEVSGSFDDCQRMVKEAFTNGDLTARVPLTSANSINLGRLIPQGFYYVWAWLQDRSRVPEPVFCVPSGNFGNLTAGLYAGAWGLPVRRYLAATNANDVVPSYLNTGHYETRASIHTLSNAMDVGAPSNYERMADLYHDKVGEFRDHITGFAVTDAETRETIARIRREHDYLMCPHTAVGWKAAERWREDHPEDDVILLSTAHPAKFLEIVEETTGRAVPLPAPLAEMAGREKQAVPVGTDPRELADFLVREFG